MKDRTLKELAELTHSTLVGDPDYRVTSVDDLESAGPKEVGFLENSRYVTQMKKSQAGVIFIHPSVQLIEGRNFLVTSSPSMAFQQVIELFIPQIRSGFSGIHPSAVIHESVELGENVTVGPNAIIDQGTKIGDRTHIGPGVSVGPGVTIGAESTLHANSVVREGCQLGSRVVLQPGAGIGSCGYGYFTDKNGKHIPLKQLGTVILEDDVEIGANTTIDRARFKTTRIKRGSKIDNLVQIAHQVEIGEDNLIVSQTGVAGSSKTGKNVVLAGQVGVIGHITIGDRSIVAAGAKVIKSIDEPGVYSGMPAIPIRKHNEQLVHIRNIGKFITRLRALEDLASELSKTHL